MPIRAFVDVGSVELQRVDAITTFDDIARADQGTERALS